jgi:hypothetical protein
LQKQHIEDAASRGTVGFYFESACELTSERIIGTAFLALQGFRQAGMTVGAAAT